MMPVRCQISGDDSPLKAINLIHQAMGAMLQSAAAGQTSRFSRAASWSGEIAEIVERTVMAPV
jgi:hypothetical protein